MAAQLGLSAPHHPLGFRHGTERRNGDRRTSNRSGPIRRRGDRRRARFRSLLFTIITLAVPHQIKHNGLNRIPWPRVLQSGMVPQVSVTIDSVVAVPAKHAYDAIIKEAAALHHVDPRLIRSVMQTESGFDAGAVSQAGAQGLMQLMPDLAQELGVDDPFDPRQNIMAGARYLRQLLTQYDGNVALTLAGYNAGPGAVARYGKVPPFPETHQYVKRVTQLIGQARSSGD
jgi:hypothetical protein